MDAGLNGCGRQPEVVLADEPIMSMYTGAAGREIKLEQTSQQALSSLQ